MNVGLINLQQKYGKLGVKGDNQKGHADNYESVVISAERIHLKVLKQ